jgi:hypothetical protein
MGRCSCQSMSCLHTGMGDVTMELTFWGGIQDSSMHAQSAVHGRSAAAAAAGAAAAGAAAAALTLNVSWSHSSKVMSPAGALLEPRGRVG